MTRRRLGVGVFVICGLALALALAFFVSPDASTKPDGLNKVAADTGLAAKEQPRSPDRTPTAGYEVKSIHNERMSKGVAGVIGVAVTFGLGLGLFTLVRARRKPAPTSTTSPR